MPTKVPGIQKKRRTPRQRPENETDEEGSECAPQEAGGRAAPTPDAVRALPGLDREAAQAQALRRAHRDNLALADGPDRSQSPSTDRTDHLAGDPGIGRHLAARVPGLDRPDRRLDGVAWGGPGGGGGDGGGLVIRGAVWATHPQALGNDQADPRSLSDYLVHRARPALQRALL